MDGVKEFALAAMVVIGLAVLLVISLCLVVLIIVGTLQQVRGSRRGERIYTSSKDRK